MKTVVCETKYESADTIIDVPQNVLQDKYVLYIGARDGQVTRLSNANIVACGWWALGKAGYLDTAGHIVADTFKEFDLIVFASPERVYKPVQDLYRQLIEVVSAL